MINENVDSYTHTHTHTHTLVIVCVMPIPTLARTPTPGGTVAEAFTNAFVHVKVVEIRSQMEQCLNCSCSLSGTLVCEPLPRANFSECVSSPGGWVDYCLMCCDP